MNMQQELEAAHVELDVKLERVRAADERGRVDGVNVALLAIILAAVGVVVWMVVFLGRPDGSEQQQETVAEAEEEAQASSRSVDQLAGEEVTAGESSSAGEQRAELVTTASAAQRTCAQYHAEVWQGYAAYYAAKQGRQIYERVKPEAAAWLVPDTPAMDNTEYDLMLRRELADWLPHRNHRHTYSDNAFDPPGYGELSPYPEGVARRYITIPESEYEALHLCLDFSHAPAHSHEHE